MACGKVDLTGRERLAPATAAELACKKVWPNATKPPVFRFPPPATRKRGPTPEEQIELDRLAAMELAKRLQNAALLLKPPQPETEIVRFNLVMLADDAPRYRCLSKGEVAQVLSTVIDGEFRVIGPNGEEGYYLPEELWFWDKGGVGYLPPEMKFDEGECKWVLHKKAVHIENSGAGRGKAAKLMRERVLQKPHEFYHDPADETESEEDETEEEAAFAAETAAAKSRSCTIS